MAIFNSYVSLPEGIAHICSLIWIKNTRSSSLIEHTIFF